MSTIKSSLYDSTFEIEGCTFSFDKINNK